MPCRQCGASLPENASFCHVCGASDPIAKTIANQDPLVGRTLNRQYRITKKLGEGGFGAVYEAEEPRFERKVAIKTIHQKLAENSITLERFRREGMAASKLEHPAAVKIYNLGETEDGLVFMAMEYIEGVTLASHLQKNGALSAKDTIELLTPIFEVLSEAHQKGIIHRDLKPQNMMLSTKGALRLLDFGISKVASAKTLTQTSTAIGTPAYMAPEQWEEGKNVGPTADLYAMGLIVYQCLTGVLPFEADTAPGWMKMHCLEAPRPLQSVIPGLPVEFSDAVMKALSKKPSDRFQDAASFLSELQRTAEGAPSTALAKSPTYKKEEAIAPSSPDAQTLAQPSSNPQPPQNSGPQTLPGVSSRQKSLLFLGVVSLLFLLLLILWMQPEPETPKQDRPTSKPTIAATAPAPAKARTWRWSNPRPQGNTLLRFFKLSDRELFMVGSVGTILRSQDGGTRWEVIPTKIKDDLRDIWITPKGEGFAVGNKGTIIRTKDGGATWSSCPGPISEDIIGVWSSDSSVVILSETKALRAASDCAKWEPASLVLPEGIMSSSIFRDLFAFQDSAVSPRIWVGGDEGLLYYSADEGKTWERLILPLGPDEGYQSGITKITSIKRGSDHELYLLRQDVAMLSSKDLGLTWTTRTPPPDDDQLGVAPFDDARLVTATNNNILAQTGDAWNSIYTLEEPYADLYDFYGDNRGIWAIGTAGRMMYSANGFSAWEDRGSRLPRRFLRAISGDASGLLVAVGEGGVLLRSTDNGETWSQEKLFYQNGGAQIESSVDDVRVVDGDVFAIANQSFLTRTDKGWEDTELNEVMLSMFYTQKKFYVGGYSGVIRSSLDRGKTWTTELALGRDAGTIRRLWQSDDKEMWAVGTKGLVLRSSGEANWEEVAIAEREKYDFLDLWGTPSLYILVGASVSRDTNRTNYEGPIMFVSKDQGKTWSKRNVALGYNGLRSVWGDSSGLYVASISGVLYHSRDEGKTWQEEFSAGNEIGRIWGQNGELFVVGSGGMILQKQWPVVSSQ
jgi:serine/threonine protein kinase